MKLPNDHPFSQFNDYFYMESGTAHMPIYLWKKGDNGILIELYLNDKESGPRGRIYSLIFEDEYNFKLDRNIRNVLGENLDDLYSKMRTNINKELEKL